MNDREKTIRIEFTREEADSLDRCIEQLDMERRREMLEELMKRLVND